VSTADEAHKAEALRRLSEFDEIKEQWKDIQLHKYRFNQFYLKDHQFIPVWAKGLQNIRIVLGCKKVCGDQIEKRRTFESILLGYEKQADHLLGALVDAAVEGILEQEILSSIQERWMRLDETLNCYHDDTDTPRSIRTWLVYKS
jgi:hypothetical protein